jgi:hypothetical protein
MIKDWEKFGKDIWDKAMSAHRTGANEVIVPILTDDGGIFNVKVSPPRYVQSRIAFDGNFNVYTEWRHGKKMSDGTIKWGEWK